MENNLETKKELLVLLAELTEDERDRSIMYIKGMVDGRKIREAAAKKKEEQRFPVETLEGA